MPMCQSPKISDILLRASTTAANDNVSATTPSLASKSILETIRSSLLLTGYRAILHLLALKRDRPGRTDRRN
ncbi:hypothetical protein JQ604_29170 [Bradyrhizobium jicamae]|uniref:hypothetical protein n=1 Tax=Bradyrhizobium jicamae TaxID=280332 RepID=UPI001BABADEF|nr:hypothetical protein [Bradyrhizobium jicamae]MBR0756267.1 hypothetical protein [Bradyrhizobium jicamae]